MSRTLITEEFLKALESFFRFQNSHYLCYFNNFSFSVYINTRSLYPLDTSFKTQLAFLIAREYYVHLW